MNDFWGNFFGKLLSAFYALCFICILGIPISFIIALFKKEPIQRRKYFLLSGKLLLSALLFFAIGFGSCVILFDLDKGGLH